MLIDTIDQSDHRINDAHWGGGVCENGAFWVDIKCGHCLQVEIAVSRVEPSHQPIGLWIGCDGRGLDAHFPCINERNIVQLRATHTSERHNFAEPR
ncbi:hypothetical protein INR49_027806 [Caranx melampygus]|nr:hypothetical protein INR49_027806 [Caranx melampygus]